MAFHLYSWTFETTSTTGTGDVILQGAVTGWRPFAAQFADGDTMRYAIYDGTNFEEGIGTYHAGANSLSRTTVIRSSNSNAAVNWAAGTRQVTCSPLGADVEQLYTCTKNGYVKRTGDPASGTPTAWSADLAGQLLATATNDNASAGNLGEYASSVVLIGSQVALTTSVTKDVATVALTAGDWEVYGELWVNPAGSTTLSALQASLNTVANTAPTVPGDATALASLQATFATGNPATLAVGPARASLSGTTTYRLQATVAFGVSTCNAYGKIRARRVR